MFILGKNRVYSIGYRHMCRFHAKTVYDQPIMQGLEYAWRLDHDSFFTRPIDYDVFKFMRDRGLVYGFVKVYLELPMWTVGLWDAAHAYIRNNSIKAQFFNKWRRNQMYYNNFEISNLTLWFSDQYQHYINYIDQEGGIYYHRWGDAPIKSIAVAMFVPRKDTYNFKDIGYIHQFFRRS
jgi:alpha 1,2-mannosyltransferase